MSETQPGGWWVPADSRDTWPDPEVASAGILDAMSDPFYVYDRRGVLVDWNDAFREMVGYDDDDELAAVDPIQFVGEETLPAAERMLREVGQGEAVTVELAISPERAEDGYYEVTATPLTDDDGEVWGLVGTARDVSRRREREQTLERYERLVETMSDGVYMTDEDSRLTAVNDAVVEMTGYDREELLGEPASVVLTDDRADEAASMRERLRESDVETATHETVVTTADGDALPIENRFSLLPGEGFQGTVGVIRDVTERRERERRLREVKERLDLALDGAELGIWDWNPQTGDLTFNDRWATMLGYDPGALDAHDSTWEGLVHPDDVDDAWAELDRLLADEVDIYETEYRMRTADGDWRWIRDIGKVFEYDDDGDPLRAVGIHQDVTERRERERRLREVKERLDMALEGAELSVWDWDVDAGEVTYDERWPKLLGYEATPVRADVASWQDGVHEADLPALVESMRSLLRDDEDEYAEAEFRAATADGEWRWIQTVGTVVERAADGTALRAVGVNRDVTERKERERRLRRHRSLVNAMRDVACIYDEDGTFEVVNEYLARAYDTTREDLEGRESRLVPRIREDAPGDRDPFRELVDGERTELSGQAEVTLPDGSVVTSEYRLTRLTADGEFDGVVCVSRDVTERRRRTDRLEAQRDELETLNRINGLVQQTLAALASAASREEIEATVCEHLGGSSLYRFAFVGARQPGGAYVEPRTWAGEGASYLDEVSIPADSDLDGSGPAARVFETGEVMVTHDVTADPLFEPFRAPALEHGFRSLAVVPLSHGGVVHGILAVYADRPGAFSEREVQAFEVLGELVGFAISAAQDRRLIETDDRVELRFKLAAPASFLATLAAELGTDCRVLGSVQTSEGGSLHYVTADADPEAVREAATAHDHCAAVRHLRTDEAAVFEVQLTQSVTTLLRESGVDPGAVEATDDGLLVTVEAPRDVSVRRLTDRLEAAYEAVTLVSRQEADRTPDAVAPTPSDPVEALTERQRAALTAAYFGGYFDWPRDSTAEEVAASLGVASPTFHQHLRHAQRKLLDSLLDDWNLDS